MKRVTSEQYVAVPGQVFVSDTRGVSRMKLAQKMFVEELEKLGNKDVDAILAKYNINIIDGNKIGIDFPADFDQKTLPKELQ